MNMSVSLKENEIKYLAECIRRADHILIGAGAGLSAAAGINYADTQVFAKLFPQMVKRGFKRQYELIGYDDWSEEEEWAYWATHANYVRFQVPPCPLYTTLLDIVADKDYFVITTNVDAQFYKSGFDAKRIFTPQGDYARLQCVKRCTTETWPTKDVIDKILPNIDPEAFIVRDSTMIPRCPRCGGRVFLNVHLDSGYNHAPYEEQSDQYEKWLQEVGDKKLLILELGVGYNSPGIIRWPFERLVHQLPNVQFVRMNEKNPEVPKIIENKSISISKDINAILPPLRECIRDRGNHKLKMGIDSENN